MAFNAWKEPLAFALPPPPQGRRWRRVVDTALASPLDAHGRPLREVETDLIRRTVREARGNVMEAARLLGISRATIYRRLRGPVK